MSGRGGKYKLAHRGKKNALNRVRQIQDGQGGKATNFQEPETINRHERRRVEKAKRKFDQLHGEGAARRGLQESAELQAYHEAQLKLKPSNYDILASKFVGIGDREGAGVRTQGPLKSGLSIDLHARRSKDEHDEDKGG